MSVVTNTPTKTEKAPRAEPVTPAKAEKELDDAAGEKKEREKPLNFGARLAVATSREAIVTYLVAGEKYGHPALLRTRFSKIQLTHSAFEKLKAELAKKGRILGPGPRVEYLPYGCLIPAELKPKDSEKTGNGDSGAIVYKFGNVKCRPGSYMIIAATESLVKHVVEVLIESVAAAQRGGNGLHMLIIKDVERALVQAQTSDGVIAMAGDYFATWRRMSEPDSIKVEKTDKDGRIHTIVKKVYKPLEIRIPSAGMVISADEMRIIDRIIDEKTKVLRINGQELYSKMKEAGTLHAAKRPSSASSAKESEDAAKRQSQKKAIDRTDLQKAFDAEKETKAPVSEKKDEERHRPHEIGYQLAPHLTQKYLFNELMEKRINSTSKTVIGKIAPEVRRFIDDLFNEIVVRITNIAIEFMAATDSLTMSERLTIGAIETFLFAILGNSHSEIRATTLHDANVIAGVLSREMARKREIINRKKAEREKKGAGSSVLAKKMARMSIDGKRKAAAEETEDDDEDEGDDVLASALGGKH